MINEFLFVSGVVLANASLDIAFHDTIWIFLLGTIMLSFLLLLQNLIYLVLGLVITTIVVQVIYYIKIIIMNI